MLADEFDELLEKRIEKTRKLLCSKGREYASDLDRLHNFKVAGRIADCSSEKALFGFLLKHLVSILDLVEGRQVLSIDIVDEKIGDAINYLILLEGLWTENIKKSTSQAVRMGLWDDKTKDHA